MSTLSVLLAVGLAMLTCVLIHQLFPGARKQLSVASMKPFGELTRPRLSIATITEKLLLACRLLLLGALAAVLLIEPPDSDAGEFAGDVVGIVPGTSQADWADLAEEDQQLVWLDRALTPVDSGDTPRAGEIADALMKLDQLMTRGATLSVVGVPSARLWPERMPAFSRSINWLGGATGYARRSSLKVPEAFWIVGNEPVLIEAVERSIALWRQAELVTDAFTAQAIDSSEFTLPDEAATIVWLAVDPPTAQRLDQTIITVGLKDIARKSASHLYLDPREAVGVFATSLWHAVSEPGLRPAAEAQVSPIVSDATIDAGEPRTMSTATVNDLPMFWVWLLVGLFVLERTLSSRGVRG